MDSYRLTREKPWGVSLGWDNDGNVMYGTGTVSLLGYADLSYMTITGPKKQQKATKKVGQLVVLYIDLIFL
jgi:hypothetical protein